MFNIGTTTVTCVATDAKSITNSCTFTVTLNAPPKIALERFLAFGDSMTWGENGSSTATAFDLAERLRPAVQLPFADTYPGALQTEMRARYTVQTPQVSNAGKPGEAVTDSTTFPRFVGFTSSGQYSAVLLMQGANDLADRDSRIFPTVISGLRRMISDAKSRGMRVFLATIPPENPAGFRALAWSLVPGFNDQIRLLASSEGVVTVLSAAKDRLEILARNELAEDIVATPAIAGTAIYVRTLRTLYAFEGR